MNECDVCGIALARDVLHSRVGENASLCMTGLNCFGWFSGYPWVLFEMGALRTYLVGNIPSIDARFIR